MKLDEFLSSANVAVDLKAGDKSQLLRELAKWAGASFNLDSDMLNVLLMTREELGSTGLGAGIAIPHARLPEVLAPRAVLVRLKRPIEYDAIDETPVDIVLLLLLPGSAPNEALNALAAAARRLREPDRLIAMRSAPTAAALYAALIA